MQCTRWLILSLLVAAAAADEGSPLSFVQEGARAAAEAAEAIAEHEMEQTADKQASDYEAFMQDQLDGEEHEQMDETKQFMQEADLNKDGKISREELHQLAESNAANLQEHFDGTEDKELLAAGEHELEMDKSKMTGMFAKADSNKDGFIDAKEAPALMQAMNEEQEDGSQVSMLQGTKAGAGQGVESMSDLTGAEDEDEEDEGEGEGEEEDEAEDEDEDGAEDEDESHAEGEVSMLQESGEHGADAEGEEEDEGAGQDDSAASEEDEGRAAEEAASGERQEFMQEVDTNKDGKVSLEELQKLAEHDAANLMQNFEGSEEDEVHAATQENLDEEKARWASFLAAADHNKDGFVDAKELPALMQAMDEADEKEHLADEADAKQGVSKSPVAV